MCFSAPASFIAGTALSATGVVTLHKTETKREIPFASIPLFFGIQQVTEGFVWLSFQYSSHAFNVAATHVFLFFAYIFWPIYVPFALGLLETDPSRRKLLSVFQMVGIGVAFYLLFMVLRHGVVSEVLKHSIAYTAPVHYGMAVTGLYVLVTCGSPLFSSNKIIRIFGIFVSFFFAVAYYFYAFAFASVWCFFAAVLSGIIYWYFRRVGGTRKI